MAYDEPDFWRWSACDMLRALGVPVHLVRNQAHGLALVKALAMKRFLKSARIVLFGEQNFPWNANAAGHLFRESLGIEMIVRPIADIRARAAKHSDDEVRAVWNERKSRYNVKDVRPAELEQALHTYLVVRSVNSVA
jgi:L-fucose isomerase-like protein